MKHSIKHSLVALTTAGLLMTAAPSFAHTAHCKDTELSQLMEGMKDDLKGYVGAFKQSDSAAMQQNLNELIAASVKAKKYVPLKLQDEMPMPNMSAEEHSQMGSMQGMQNMEGMSHSAHMEHMRYLEGIDKLSGLLRQLQAAGDDKAQVKALLGEIKQHSKSSHEAFRKECD